MDEKPPLESDILREICEYFEEQDLFFWRSNNIPVFGKSSDGKKRFRSMPKHSMKGVADITMVHRCMPVFIEVKRNKNCKLSDHQIEFQDKVRKHGGLYFVAYNLEMAVKIVKELNK